MHNKTLILENAGACWRAFSRLLSDIFADERGLSTIEYSTMGGVMSGIIFMAGDTLRQAQMAAIERMAYPD